MKSHDTLVDFVAYCEEHPYERFWQALRNWSEHGYILVSENHSDTTGGYEDTFYWSAKEK